MDLYKSPIFLCGFARTLHSFLEYDFTEFEELWKGLQHIPEPAKLRKNTTFGCSGDVVLGPSLQLQGLLPPKKRGFDVAELSGSSWIKYNKNTIKSYQEPASTRAINTSALKTMFTRSQISPRLPLP